jgi:tRNA-splicing ligase RtcB
VLTHQVRIAFEKVYGSQGTKLRVACDSPSNIVDLERLDDELVCLHRRAATIAFGPGKREEVPRAYRDLGDPLLVLGNMASSSYVLLATDGASTLSLASANHGAGRAMSRKQARKTFAAHELKERLAQSGVLARSPRNTPELREEIPEAYRDPEKAVSVLECAGVARRVARIHPRAVFKG